MQNSYISYLPPLLPQSSSLRVYSRCCQPGEQCAEEICEPLRELPGVISARGEIQKDRKRLHLELSPDADEDLVYDTLEQIGVFV